MNENKSDYYYSISEYLRKKFPDAPLAVIEETSDYIVNKTMSAMVNAIDRRDQMWRDDFRRTFKKKNMSTIVHGMKTLLRRSKYVWIQGGEDQGAREEGS